MNQVFNIPVGGTLSRQALGFEAASLIVDNYTPDYVLIPDAGKTIPPWIYGAVVSVPPGITSAVATLFATTPALPGPPVPVQQVTLTWTDRQLAASAGHLLQQSTLSQQTVVTTITVAASGSNRATYQLPSGTQSVGYMWEAFSPNQAPSIVEIQGAQTGQSYIFDSGTSVPPQAAPQPRFAPIAAADTGVIVEVDANSLNQCTVFLLALPFVVATPQPISVAGSPAAWEATNVSGDVGASTIAAGASVVIIPAPGATVRTRLKRVAFSVNAAANTFGTIECPAGTSRGKWDGTIARNYDYEFGFLDCGLNAGVVIHNTSAAGTGNVNGFAVANQS